jgi:hypothetical protein
VRATSKRSISTCYTGLVAKSCPHSTDCPMYGLFTLAGTLSVWQAHYCNADFEKCERYQRTLRGEHVPVNLLPNGKMLKVPTKK